MRAFFEKYTLIINKLPLLFAGIIILYFIFISWQLSQHRYFDSDEFQHIHIAWCMKEGGILYKDVIDHHGPLFPLLNVTLWKIFNLPDEVSTIFFFRHLSFLGFLFILLMTFLIGKKLFNSETGLYAVLLLVINPIFIEKVIEIRPDILMNSLYLLGLYLLIGIFQDKKENLAQHVLISLLLWIMALWLHIKISIIVFPLVIFTFIFLQKNSTFNFKKNMGLLIANILIPSILIILSTKFDFILCSRIFLSTIKWLSIRTIENFSNTLVILISNNDSWLPPFPMFVKFGFFDISFKLTALFSVIYIFFTSSKESYYIQKILGLITLGGILFINIFYCWTQWYIMVLPISAILIAYFLNSLLTKGILSISLQVILLLVISIILFEIVKVNTITYKKILEKNNNHQQLDLTNFVLKTTSKTDPIFFFFDNYGGYMFRPHVTEVFNLLGIIWYAQIQEYQDMKIFQQLETILLLVKCNYIIAGENELSYSEFKNYLEKNFFQSKEHSLFWIRKQKL